MGRSANNLDKIVVRGAAPPLRFPFAMLPYLGAVDRICERRPRRRRFAFQLIKLRHRRHSVICEVDKS
jgi:hypothetical protein